MCTTPWTSPSVKTENGNNMRICLLLLLMALTRAAAAQSQVITLNPGPRTAEIKVNPLNWFVGMKDHAVQLMLYAPGIGGAAARLSAYPGVSITWTPAAGN